MKFKPTDHEMLAQAYETILEGGGGMPPTAGAASRSGSNPGVHNSNGEPLTDDQMQTAMDILARYAQQKISAEQAAAEFKSLYEQGV